MGCNCLSLPLILVSGTTLLSYGYNDTKPPSPLYVGPWASYQIRKIAGCACAGNAENLIPRHRLQRKPRVSNPGMYLGTCVTHVPWCMSGSLTRGGGENVPGIPSACATCHFTYLARGPREPHIYLRIQACTHLYIDGHCHVWTRHWNQWHNELLQ